MQGHEESTGLGGRKERRMEKLGGAGLGGARGWGLGGVEKALG